MTDADIDSEIVDAERALALSAMAQRTIDALDYARQIEIERGEAEIERQMADLERELG